MIWPTSEEEKRLIDMVDPYYKFELEGVADDAPEEVKAALKRLREIGRQEDELEKSLQ